MTPTLDQLLATVVREHYPHPPATEVEIAAFESSAGWQLGAELRAFYLRCNGAELFEPLPNARYSLLSLGELQRARVRMRGIDDDSMGPASWWTLVDCQDSDFILVDVAQPPPYPLLDAYHGTYPAVTPVAASLREFLARALTSNNRLYWLHDDQWIVREVILHRGDRSATRDPRLASFVVTTGGSFRLQVPDGRYHVTASVGDNTFGSGLASVELAGAGIVYGVGKGHTAGTGLGSR